MKKIIFIVIGLLLFISPMISAQQKSVLKDGTLARHMRLQMESYIPYYESMASCTPIDFGSGPVILGIKDGNCTYHLGYVEYDGKKYPKGECSAPLSVINSYANEKIHELKKGILRYNSETDILQNYCKNTTVTIKTENAEITVY